MRTMIIMAGGYLAMLGAVAPVRAQIVQKEITQPQAEVRCLPGELNDTIFTTNMLRSGDVVSMVEDLGNGWLKILPPPGSFSWIRKKDLIAGPRYAGSNSPDIYIVNSDSGTKTFIGSERDPKKKGNVFGSTLPRGVLVRKVQRDSYFDHEGEWLPVEPPASNPPEFRYIRKEAVTSRLVAVASQQPMVTTSNFTSVSRTPSLNGTQTPSPGVLPQPQVPTEAQKLWQKAQQAERSGDLGQAMDLYSQMATRTPGNSFDHDLAMQGLNRVYFLREGQRNPSSNMIPPLPVSQIASQGTSTTYYNPPVSSNTGRSASQFTGNNR